ncbi:MAG: DUF177 domain-containing protein [Woeseia sp.]
MANPLLDRWSPQELAERGQVIEKEENLELFPRLTEVVALDLRSVPEAHRPARWRQAPVAIRLVFGWADSRRRLPQVTGRVSAQVAALCQRCLEPFALTLTQELRFLLAWPGSPGVESQGFEGFAAGFEIWDLDEPVVRPLDIVDEALIMALPLSARHADLAECGSLAALLAGDSDRDSGDKNGDNKVRPFADLRSRMQQDD